MEIANEKFLDLKYNTEYNRFEVKEKNKIWKVVKKYKILSILSILFIMFSVLNVFLIYNFIKIINKM